MQYVLHCEIRGTVCKVTVMPKSGSKDVTAMARAHLFFLVHGTKSNLFQRSTLLLLVLLAYPTGLSNVNSVDFQAKNNTYRTFKVQILQFLLSQLTMYDLTKKIINQA